MYRFQEETVNIQHKFVSFNGQKICDIHFFEKFPYWKNEMNISLDIKASA